MNRSFLITQVLLAAGAFGATPSLPLYFEPNQGQAHPKVEFLSRGKGSLSYLTSKEAIFTVGGSPVNMHLAGASASKPEGIDRLPGTSSYFRGQDKTKWHTSIPQFAKVRYRDVYPGVDLIYYGTGGNIEYDFQIAPGADPARIRIAYEGTSRVRLDQNGDLILSTKTGELRQRSPKVYQEVDGKRMEIAAAYKLDGRKNVGLALAAYDRSKPLIVDPVLQYSTYFGGPGLDRGEAVQVDPAGNIYLAATLAMPQSDSNPFSSSPTNTAGPTEAAVIKFSPAQNAILLVAHLGADGTTSSTVLAVDPAGEMFLGGATTSTDFPLVNPIVSKYAITSPYWGIPFVTKIAADGSTLMYSTYFGGSIGEDYITGAALDAAGNLYLAGNADSPDFPKANALYSSGQNAFAFLAKFSAAGSIVFSTVYPGMAGATAFALDSTGAYFAGTVVPQWFPKVNSIRNDTTVLQAPAGGPVGAVKLSLDGQTVLYSTMFGGTLGDNPHAGAVDSQGHFYVAGITSDTDFPVVNAPQSTSGGGEDGFIAELSPTGNSLLFGTYLGGKNQDFVAGITLDSAGNIYVVGTTQSPDFPVLNSIATSTPKSPSQASPYEGYLAAYSASGKSLLYSTLIGGSQQDSAFGVAVDATENVYVLGTTSSPDLPVTNNAYQHTLGGSYDAFLMVINPGAVSLAPTVSVSPQVLTFTAPGNTPQPAQTVTLTGAAGAVFTASVTTASGGNWLAATLVGANQLSVSANPAGLAQGDYQGTVQISTGSGNPATISVVLHIPAPPAVLTSYSLTAAASANPIAPPLTIYGSGFVANASAKVYLDSNLPNGQPSYIYIEPGLVTLIDSHTVQLYPGVGSPTPITIAISVTNPGSVESNALPVLIGPPSPSITGVQNSAFASQPNAVQPIAPGEMITITGLDFGSPVGMSAPANAGMPSMQLGNTQVLFNGVAVPITYVSFSQINALAPFSLSGALTANIAVNYLGVTSAPVTVQVVPSMTGLFTANASGSGQGWILNQDSTPNSASNPAAVGSTVTVFATGMGATNPPIPDGTIPQSASIQPVLPVAAMIGAQAANVVSAYAAPGMLGVLAAQVQVPSVPSGSAIPIQLGVGTSPSQTGVTIAIK